MNPLTLWLLCGLVSSTAFVFSERHRIRYDCIGTDDLILVGLVIVTITLAGPLALTGLCVGLAAKALARLLT